MPISLSQSLYWHSSNIPSRQSRYGQEEELASHLESSVRKKQSQKLEARKRNYSHICTLIFFIAECHSKIMTQGFKMRSQPLFICPALWPRYRCGEGKDSHSLKRSIVCGYMEKVFFHLHRRPVSTREASHTVFEGEVGGRGGGVIALTTKNHMHIHFCASNYEWAAGHWLTLIIAPFVLSFYEWQSSKGKKKKKEKKKRSLPWELIVTQSLVVFLSSANNPTGESK